MNKYISQRKRAQKTGEKSKNGDLFTFTMTKTLGTACVREFRFHPKRLWRFDYAIPDHRIALEVEGGVWTGGRHTRPRGFLGDMEKYNSAALLGWRVFRCTPQTLFTTQTVEMLSKAVKEKF